VRLPEGLRPPELSRVALHLEVLVAFRSAKAEHLNMAGDGGERRTTLRTRSPKGWASNRRRRDDEKNSSSGDELNRRQFSARGRGGTFASFRTKAIP
jgi:hypothetical protein